MTRFFLIALLVQAGVIVYGQSHPMLTDSSHLLSVGINSDAYFRFTASYYKRLAWKSKCEGGILMGEIQLPFSYLVNKHKNHAFKAYTAYRYGYIHKGGFSLIGDLGCFFFSHSQLMGDFNSLGLDIKLTPGLQLGKFNVGLYYQWRNVICTHINYSDNLKDGTNGPYNPDSEHISNVDGWSPGSGSSFSYGLTGYARVTKKALLCVDLGVRVYQTAFTGSFDEHMPGPIPFSISSKLIFSLSGS